ncbi:galactokinase [Planosporangium sp. 12N6]|uniref:galactokinase n=1 Tax=Planosporangium spinosum TaxID=3402278 RepID=UPI003CF9BDCA
MSPADRAARLAAERFGTASAAVWVAPGRVNLIGEHTDYNEGYVLPFALPQVTAAAVAPADGTWTVCSEGHDGTVSFGASELKPGAVGGWGSYVAGVVWALRDAGFAVPPARIAIASDVPVGAGLSSSAAVECAVMAALCDLGDVSISDGDRVRIAQRAENEYVGAPTGIMDQSASTLSRAGHALFLDCRTLDVEHIPFDVAAAGLAVLVIDTNAPHRHVDGEYADRRATCDAAARTLGVPALRDISVAQLPEVPGRLDEVSARRVRHIVTENQRVLDTVDRLRAGDIAGIGPLMTASHGSMRDDFEITVPEVDTAVAAALEAGAYGARMTGGGFGGCVLALIDDSRAEAVSAAVSSAFESAGFAPPDPFVVTPNQGVHRA